MSLNNMDLGFSDDFFQQANTSLKVVALEADSALGSLSESIRSVTDQFRLGALDSIRDMHENVKEVTAPHDFATEIDKLEFSDDFFQQVNASLKVDSLEDSFLASIRSVNNQLGVTSLMEAGVTNDLARKAVGLLKVDSAWEDSLSASANSVKDQLGVASLMVAGLADEFSRQERGWLKVDSALGSLSESIRSVTDQFRLGALDSIRDMREKVSLYDLTSRLGEVTAPHDFATEIDKLTRTSLLDLGREALHPLDTVAKGLGDAKGINPLSGMTKTAESFTTELAKGFQDNGVFYEDRKIAGLLGGIYEHQRRCRPLAEEPAFSTRTSALPPPQTVHLTLKQEPYCFLCDAPMVFAEPEAELLADHVLLARLAVLPCAACVRRILHTPNYLLDKLREIAMGGPRLTAIDGGRQGDGIPNRKGGLWLVPTPKKPTPT
jgi:hypothetical protein